MKTKYESKDLIGIVCSEDLSEAYCVEGSGKHKRMKSKKDLFVVYIPHYYLNQLIHESFNGAKFKWNIEKILEYSRKV